MLPDLEYSGLCEISRDLIDVRKGQELLNLNWRIRDPNPTRLDLWNVFSTFYPDLYSCDHHDQYTWRTI